MDEMTSRERIIAALTFREFDRAPIKRPDMIKTEYEYPGRSTGVPVNTKGKCTDAWGCV